MVTFTRCYRSGQFVATLYLEWVLCALAFSPGPKRDVTVTTRAEGDCRSQPVDVVVKNKPPANEASRGFLPALRKKPLLVRLLHFLGVFLPGNWLKTAVYLNFVKKPRGALRKSLWAFYRIDHIYDVLSWAHNRCRGRFSILEFGTSDGYAFTRMLYATRYTKMADRVVVHGFDTFEGMPPPVAGEDDDLSGGDTWVEGEFRGHYDDLAAYCKKRYPNHRLHKGLFDESLTPRFLETLRSDLPLLIWFDCDYYSSARVVMQRLLPYIPNGCVIYFDDFDDNYGSRFTGESRLVAEMNRGEFGDDVELILDRNLSLDSNRCYRFVRAKEPIFYPLLGSRHKADYVHRRTNDSPLP